MMWWTKFEASHGRRVGVSRDEQVALMRYCGYGEAEVAETYRMHVRNVRKVWARLKVWCRRVDMERRRNGH